MVQAHKPYNLEEGRKAEPMLASAGQTVKDANCLIINVSEGGIVASKKVLPRESGVTRGSIREYTEAVRSEVDPVV